MLATLCFSSLLRHQDVTPTCQVLGVKQSDLTRISEEKANKDDLRKHARRKTLFLFLTLLFKIVGVKHATQELCN